MDKLVVYPTTLQRGTSGSAGLDLRCTEQINYEPLWNNIIHTGVHVAIPKGWVGLLSLRSSLAKSGVILMNGVGIIDSDYRGEIMLLTKYLGDNDNFSIPQGSRVAQLVVVPCPHLDQVAVSDVEDLGWTVRGSGGFGSTGQL